MIRLYGKLICLFTVVIVSTVATEEVSAARSAVNCPEVTVMDLHGSGAGPNESSATGAFMAVRLRNLLKGRHLEFETVPFSSAGNVSALAGGALKLPAAYHKSVVRTKNWLRKRLEKLAGTCQNTKVILTGYSQGAQVAGDVYQERSWKQVVGVALFGDPYYNDADTSNRYGLNIRNKRQRIKSTLKGALAAPKPRPAFNSGRVLSFCHQFDPVCQAPLSNKEKAHFKTTQHKNYTDFGEPETAAIHFAKLLKGEISTPRASKWPTKRHDGSPAFSIYLGASFIFPEWSSCSPNFCIVGAENRVYFFAISGGIELIAHISASTDPVTAFQRLNEHLRRLGKSAISPEEIKELLRE